MNKVLFFLSYYVKCVKISLPAWMSTYHFAVWWLQRVRKRRACSPLYMKLKGPPPGLSPGKNFLW